MKKSLGVLIVGVTVLITVTAASVSSYSLYRNIRADLEQKLSTLHFEDSRQFSLLLQKTLTSMVKASILTRAKVEDDAETLDLERARRGITLLQQQQPYFSWIGLTDRQGSVLVAGKGLLEGADVSTRPWFQKGLAGPYVSDTHKAVLLGKILKPEAPELLRFIDIALPVRNRSGQVLGVLGVHVDVKWAEALMDEFIDQVVQNRRLDIVVLNSDNEVIIASDNGVLNKQLTPDSILSASRDWNQEISNLYPEGKLVLSSNERALYMGDLAWSVVTVEDQDSAFAALADMKNQFFGAIAGFVLIAAAGALAGATWLNRPLRHFAAEIKRFRNAEEGELSLNKALTSRYAEVDYLSDEFETLVDSLSEREQELITLNEELEARVEARSAELKDALERVQQERAAKELFFASMTHELRTPINALLGASELLSESASERERQEAVDLIQNSGGALRSVVNDILDYSKLEAGKLALSQEPFDVHDLVNDTLRMFSNEATAKGVALVAIFGPKTPLEADTDPVRLRQVLTNLVSNSLKFSKGGWISIEVSPDSANTRINFSVKDVAGGMPPDKLKMLFQDYSQVSDTATKRAGGTGLGLSISKNLCEMMGGTLRVSSEEGVGSEFTFDVAMPSYVFESGEMVVPRRDLSGIEVLVIAKTEPEAVAVIPLLEAAGARVSYEPTPETALSKWAPEEAPEKQLVLMLLSRSDSPEDTLVAVQRLQEAKHIKNSQVIIAANDREKREALADADHFVIGRNPVSLKGLFAVLDQIIDSSPAPAAYQGEDQKSDDDAAQVTEPSGEALKDMSILLVEDDSFNRRVVSAQLEKLGCRCDTAENGEDAWTRIQDSNFDLILTDINMPKIDGFELCRLIKERDAKDGTNLSVVALTGADTEAEIAQIKAEGFDDHILKPVTRDELHRKIAAIAVTIGD